MANELLRNELAEKEGSPYAETKEARILAFKNGWDAAEEICKPDWFKAGGMAERILIDWEMKQLKEKLEQEKFESATKDISLDSVIAERDELKHRCKALEDRIKIITEKYNINV